MSLLSGPVRFEPSIQTRCSVPYEDQAGLSKVYAPCGLGGTTIWKTTNHTGSFLTQVSGVLIDRVVQRTTFNNNKIIFRAFDSAFTYAEITRFSINSETTNLLDTSAVGISGSIASFDTFAAIETDSGRVYFVFTDGTISYYSYWNGSVWTVPINLGFSNFALIYNLLTENNNVYIFARVGSSTVCKVIRSDGSLGSTITIDTHQLSYDTSEQLFVIFGGRVWCFIASSGVWRSDALGASLTSFSKVWTDPGTSGLNDYQLVTNGIDLALLFLKKVYSGGHYTTDSLFAYYWNDGAGTFVTNSSPVINFITDATLPAGYPSWSNTSVVQYSHALCAQMLSDGTFGALIDFINNSANCDVFYIQFDGTAVGDSGILRTASDLLVLNESPSLSMVAITGNSISMSDLLDSKILSFVTTTDPLVLSDLAGYNTTGIGGSGGGSMSTIPSGSGGIQTGGPTNKPTYCVFEFYEMMTPENVETLPVAKRYDQLGPMRFDKIAKIFGFRIRLIMNGSTTVMPYEIYGDDSPTANPINSNPLYTNSFAVFPGIDYVYEIQLPKSVNSDIVRLVIGPTADSFHRYDVLMKIQASGMQGQSKWIPIR